MTRLGCAIAIALASSWVAAPALATDVTSGSVSVGPASPVQLGRLSRNGVQQDWTGTETYPGVINTGTSYAFTTIAAPFGANAFQTVYYDINFDDEMTDLFISAYMDSYDPANKALNWLGDAGSSGNYFPGDPRFFDVVVPIGHSLTLVVNSASGRTASSTANYLVSAFSDTEYSENFLTAAPAVPEPAAWMLMIAGFGVAGGVLRRRARPQRAVATG
ncbi:PEPxxWA-CTERM sorting domain-containing protein [Sphingomonas sp.]|uniref:PEPxxWA-CTERM sorting domain-containing protein n=1 Tax=Sphingomonas sp. TaxID=28214 RepID=UPI003CC525D9